MSELCVVVSPTIESPASIRPGLHEQSPAEATHIFGVFDGHGGDYCAKFCAMNLKLSFLHQLQKLARREDSCAASDATKSPQTTDAHHQHAASPCIDNASEQDVSPGLCKLHPSEVGCE